ncbi:MAG: magnesium chelatase subunit H [Candidatus Helarchaeota archaeon]
MKTKICLYSNPANLNSIPQAIKEINEIYPDILDFKYFNITDIDSELISEEKVAHTIINSDILLIDIRTPSRASNLLIKTINEHKYKGEVIVLVGGAKEVLSLTKIGSLKMDKILKRSEGKPYDWKKIQRIMNMFKKLGWILPFGMMKHARNWVLMMDYWSHSGVQNIKNLFLFILKNYGKQKVKYDSVVKIEKLGIYNPFLNKFYSNLKDYFLDYKYDRKKRTVGILFYSKMYFYMTIDTVKELISHLEPHVNVLPIFSEGMENLKAIEKFFMNPGYPIDCVANFLWFRLNGGPFGGDPMPTLKILSELNVPVFNMVAMYQGEIKRWKESTKGLSPVETICTVMLPELDGLIDPIPSLGLRDLKENTDFSNYKITVPIKDRVEKIAGRILKWVNLKVKKNQDKKLAIIFYNYPPGEDNLGNAAYLDVFQSISKIIDKLKENGYNVNSISKDTLNNTFISQGLINSSKWSTSELRLEKNILIDSQKYEQWLRKIPETSQKDIFDNWGPAPGKINVINENILIPGIISGNIFIGLQPSRGIAEDVQKAYHDKNLPPHHQYLAFYKWIENEFQADAIIHVGTHGTLEFLKGKEVGLSETCFPDILIGSLPHLYIYHVTNTSEAMIAKRRSYGEIINYKTPPFFESDLYEEYSELEELIHEYNEAKVQDEIRAKRVKEKILKVAKSKNITTDSIDEIYDILYETKKATIPKGLHIFGQKYSKEELINYLNLILKHRRGELPSLHELIAKSKSLDYYDLLKKPNQYHNDQLNFEIIEYIENLARKIITKLMISIESAMNVIEMPPTLQNDFLNVLKYAEKVLNDIKNSKELENLIRALNGEYILPNGGGDPIRTPESFPTGRNTFQFDPRLIPSEAAYSRGFEIAEETLRKYFKKYKKYPESIGLILWGFETAQTRGETVGQILSYLGVRAVTDAIRIEPKIELIPLTELKRPRIDVTINICGFFRDLFPNVIQLLNNAVALVSEQEEPDSKNYIKRHSQEIFQKISGEIQDLKTVKRLSESRVFGPRAGEYGTNLTRIIETSNWAEEKQLGESYIESMDHMYSENVHAKSMKKVFQTLLSKVEIVSQIRNTNEYDFVDLDHYYEFFGGLSKAVELNRGEKPEMLVSDTTEEIIRIKNVNEVISKGIRTRLLNPKWANALLKHDYHGAQKIGDRVENLLGFAATTKGVDNWIWDDISDFYLFNEEMRNKLKDNNKWATHEMALRLYEAYKRGYWEANEDQIKKLKEIILEVEGWIEESL